MHRFISVFEYNNVSQRWGCANRALHCSDSQSNILLLEYLTNTGSSFIGLCKSNGHVFRHLRSQYNTGLKWVDRMPEMLSKKNPSQAKLQVATLTNRMKAQAKNKISNHLYLFFKFSSISAQKRNRVRVSLNCSTNSSTLHSPTHRESRKLSKMSH